MGIKTVPKFELNLISGQLRPSGSNIWVILVRFSQLKSASCFFSNSRFILALAAVLKRPRPRTLPRREKIKRNGVRPDKF